MSYVTNVLLSFSITEDYDTDATGEDIYHVMMTINAWLTDHGYGAFGQNADHVAGGHKHLEMPLYVAGFNYFVLSDFLTMLRALPWREPDAVQVFVKEQDESKFTMVEPCLSMMDAP